MKNKKGMLPEGVGDLLVIVIIALVGIGVIYMIYSGFSTPQDEARNSAVDIAAAMSRLEDTIITQEFEVVLEGNWYINIDSENQAIYVLSSYPGQPSKLDSAYGFKFPEGYTKICCPEALAEGYCSQYCPNTAVIGEGTSISRTFCVTTYDDLIAEAAAIIVLPIPGASIPTYIATSLIVDSETLIIYPKSGFSCSETLEVLLGNV